MFSIVQQIKKHIYPAFYQSMQTGRIFLFNSEHSGYSLTGKCIGEFFDELSSCKDKNNWKRIEIKIDSLYPNKREIGFPILCSNQDDDYVLFFGNSRGIAITLPNFSSTNRLKLGSICRCWVSCEYLKTWFPVNMKIK